MEFAMHMRRLVFLLAILTVVFVLGCGGEKEYPISGTVTYNGNPVPRGTIFFDPDSGAGNSGSQGFAVIEDGKFDTVKAGRGTHGGAYIVRVQGYDGKPAPEAPYGKAVFAEHVEKRDLPKQATELEIVVPVSK